MADQLLTGTTLIEDKRGEFGKVWSCPGIAFRAIDGGLNSMDYGNAYVETTGDWLAAPVYLPNGAEVIGVVVYGVDTGEEWQLVRKQTSAVNVTTVMATAAFSTEDTSITSAIIDNSTYSYYLMCTSDLDDSDIIYGARIRYK